MPTTPIDHHFQHILSLSPFASRPILRCASCWAILPSSICALSITACSMVLHCRLVWLCVFMFVLLNKKTPDNGNGIALTLKLAAWAPHTCLGDCIAEHVEVRSNVNGVLDGCDCRCFVVVDVVFVAVPSRTDVSRVLSDVLRAL